MHTQYRRHARGRWPLAYAILGGLFILIGGMNSLLPTGLYPEPIGPYLNGIFPQQTPGNGGSGNIPFK